jgi:serine/threonine protein kinase/tetratricopeptide (TPR) repeat protein
MGEVYRARDLRLGREVAVKVLPAEVASSPDRLARFEREARTVAGLNHPNIVTLFTIEDADGVRFLTMELVDGQTLSTLITPGGLPLPKLLELAIPLTDALVAAHEKGVIHRDLKPGNVMVTRDGRVKVLDFGLAKVAAGESSAADPIVSTTVDLTASGERAMVGTVPYMSPEQLRGEAVDARSDLFSLGIILYELATGQRPFTGGTSVEISSAILRDTPSPLSRIRPELPADLERIVSRCLEKSPRERAQSAIEVSNELRRPWSLLERGDHNKPASEKVASIAVLPFENRSPTADDEYFSDGLADELLNVLSKTKRLRVTARTSAFQFKGSKDDVPTIGRKLNVATLLEGSVRKAGNRIRVSVQLVNVADSSHLWSETYDRTLEDIFAVQDDIAQSVVRELRTTLLGETDSDASGGAKAEVAQAVRGRATDPEAHRLYLLARHLGVRYTREDTAKAIGYLKEALARDPEFALAWAELSSVYTTEANVGWVSAAEGYGRAREALVRALSLDPDLPEGHAQMGWIQMSHDWDFRRAQASFTRALELSPGLARVLRLAGVLACALGGLEEGIGLFHRASEHDPLSASGYYNIGVAVYAAGRFAEAETAYRRALELAPQGTGMRASLSLTLLALGRGDEALAEALREPDESHRLRALTIVHHVLGSGAESDATLEGLIEKYAGDAAYQIAEVHGARGEVERAFEWLERAYAQRDSGLSVMKVNPRLRSLHGDPRWGAFLKKMGLEDETQL